VKKRQYGVLGKLKCNYLSFVVDVSILALVSFSKNVRTSSHWPFLRNKKRQYLGLDNRSKKSPKRGLSSSAMLNI
jgi:hypothetical protein